MLFVSAHKKACGFLCRKISVQNSYESPGDRHIHIVFFGKSKGRPGGIYALDDHANLLYGLIRRKALTY